MLLLLNVVMSGKLDLSRLQTKLWIPSASSSWQFMFRLPVNNYWALMTFKDMLLMFVTLSRHRDVSSILWKR